MYIASSLYIIPGVDRDAAVRAASEMARAAWRRMAGSDCPDEYLSNASVRFHEQWDKRRRSSIENPPARHVVSFPILAGAISAQMEGGNERAVRRILAFFGAERDSHAP